MADGRFVSFFLTHTHTYTHTHTHTHTDTGTDTHTHRHIPSAKQLDSPIYFIDKRGAHAMPATIL